MDLLVRTGRTDKTDEWMDGSIHRQRCTVQSQWGKGQILIPMTSKSLKNFKLELDVHVYVREIYTSANLHFNPFSGGFSPDG